LLNASFQSILNQLTRRCYAALLKKMRIILVVFAISLLGRSDRIASDDGPNWSVYIEEGEIQYEKSLEFILSVPVHHYWDTGKGSYRTGILADLIHLNFTSYVSEMSLRTIRNGRLITIPDVRVIDQVAVYDQMLVVIQHISRSLVNISSITKSFSQAIRASNDIAHEISKSTRDDWRSSFDIRSERVSLELRVQGLKELIEIESNTQNKVDEVSLMFTQV